MRPVLLLGALLAACDGGERMPPALTVGAPAPVYAGRSLAGDSVRTGPGAPVTLLNLWATWCIPCRREFPLLARLQDEYGPRGLRIVAVSVGRDAESSVAEFLRLRRVPFTVGVDRSGRTQRRFQSVGLPESYLIDGGGVLRYRVIGAIPDDPATLRGVLDSLLPPAAPAPAGR